MCADVLQVALVVPNIDAFSGGMERTLKLVEHSASAGIRYTCFVPPGGAPNAEVAKRLEDFEREGTVEQRVLDARNRINGSHDVVAIPTEYWWGAHRRARAAGLLGPFSVDFHQLPYIGTLDILKCADIDNPSLSDLGRIPFLQRRGHWDGLVSSAVQTAASVVSVRWSSHLRDGRVMALTPVVEKNLAVLGYRGPAFVPTCPNGIEGSSIETHLQREEPIPFDGVFVGRFHPQKGFLDLPRVVAHLTELLGRDAKIALCGGSALPMHMARFKDQTQSLGVERNLTVLGRVPKADLYRTIARSKLLVYPSYVDGFSLTVLESLCLGVPVVAYDIDAMRMIWRNRKAVVRARVGDPRALAEAAAQLLQDSRWEGLRKQARSQSRDLLSEFTWPRVVAEERRFYESTISEVASAG